MGATFKPRIAEIQVVRIKRLSKVEGAITVPAVADDE